MFGDSALKDGRAKPMDISQPQHSVVVPWYSALVAETSYQFKPQSPGRYSSAWRFGCSFVGFVLKGRWHFALVAQLEKFLAASCIRRPV